MKLKFLSLFFVLGSVSILSTSALRDPNNPPTGRTGAPGETTCMASGCHTGGTFTGTVTLTGVPDTVLVGHTYPLTVVNTSNAVRAGFQLTCLDSLNVKCGTVSSAAGVNIGTGNSRQYARQSSPKNLAGGSTSWTFNWTAPASAAGNKAKFYFVSLCSNNNGQKTGDNVLVNTKPVVFTQTSGTAELLSPSDVSVYPTQISETLSIDLKKTQRGHLALYHINGQLAMESDLVDKNRIEVTQLTPGTYVARIQTDAGFITKKIVKY